MKLYRIVISTRGSHEFWRAGLQRYIGVTTIAHTSHGEALKAYNREKKKLAGLPCRLRLELIQVPDRLTSSDWVRFLETEIMDITVLEVLRTEETKEVA